MPDRSTPLVISSADQLLDGRSRRNFLKLMAVGGTAVLLPTIFTACESGPDSLFNSEVVLDLSTDAGILNYAYALEQLEVDFYERVVNQFSSSNLTVAEKEVLLDIRNHEVIHRKALAALLAGGAIRTLSFRYTGVDFNDRLSVLQTARTFEDLGVAAYNGAGQYLSDVQNLLVAGKVVSVEARHASVIRDLLNPGSADFGGGALVNSDGLDRAFTPAQVFSAAGGFFETPISIGTAP